jgi:hypothetical protein
MNTILTFLTGLILSLRLSGDIPYTTIERSMENNDAKTLVHLGKDKISLNIQGKEAVYPIAQAEIILQGFFTKYPKGTFSFKFKGKETGDDQYTIGTYVSKGESFRSTFHFHTNKSDVKLESLSITNE